MLLSSGDCCDFISWVGRVSHGHALLFFVHLNPSRYFRDAWNVITNTVLTHGCHPHDAQNIF
jgi:hypothetical protein